MLSWEITSSGISLGHEAAHSPMFVQPPKPSASCWATMLTTRASRSACPWGSSPRWVIFAPMNSMPLAFGHAATHAPQAMHVAASNARSAFGFGTGVACASGAAPVLTEMYPPAWMIRSKADRSTTRSLITGKASARHGSTVIVSPSLKLRMCSWQVVVTSGPCAMPEIIIPQVPQMPSRQSESNAIGSIPCAMRFSLSSSSISRKLMSSEMSSTW